MKMGPLSLKNNLFLAPMLNITTGPYRRFCRILNNIGLVSLPMLYAKRIETNPKSVERDLYKIEQERPISIQIIGSNIPALKNSLDFLSSYEFDLLDINAGCPSRRAIKAKEGGYLLNDLRLLTSILKVVIKFSPKPVSLKIRIGFQNLDNFEKLVQTIKNSEIALLIVHGRKVQDKFTNSTLDLEAIKRLKEALNIPIVGNGDIDNPIFAKKFLDYTKADALMIGRGSIGNPEIFSQIENYFLCAKLEKFENNLNKVEQYGKLYEQCIDEYLFDNNTLPYSPERYKFIELKRNMIWLTKQIENSTNIRIKIAQSVNLDDLKGKLSEIFNSQN